MLFPTVEYGLFFLAVFALAWACRRSARAHKAVLLVASYAFYGCWEIRFLPLLVALSLLAGLVGRALQVEPDARWKKTELTIGIAVALSVLFFFKYLGFFAVALAGTLRALGLPVGTLRLPEVALPVGISFFAFHAISLMTDAYRGRIPVRVTLLDALLYVAFFPQLVAGPILRSSNFLVQLSAPPQPGTVDAARAFELITLGLAKKVLVANFLATRLVDRVFDAPGNASGLEALLAIYGYAAQIYCDFSGYTDIAIGSALLLGYRLPPNFNAPYLADSPQDFWRRWHISLSTWLRDYLFISLGGSRDGRLRTLRNLMITMVLGGLWHGAAWNFVAWGTFHGLALVVHRFWADASLPAIRAVRTSRPWPLLSRVLTFHFVCVGWVLFRANSLGGALEVLRALTGSFSATGFLTVALILALVAGLFGQMLPLSTREALRLRFSRLPLAAQGMALAAVVLAIEAFGPRGIAPFIYFQF